MCQKIKLSLQNVSSFFSTFIHATVFLEILEINLLVIVDLYVKRGRTFIKLSDEEFEFISR